MSTKRVPRMSETQVRRPRILPPLTQNLAEVQTVGQLPMDWAEDRPNKRNYANLASRSGNRNVAFAKIYQAPDGRLLTLAPPPHKVPPQPLGEGANAMVRMEFLDRQSGDTVVFLQMRNVPLVDAFPGYRLSGPKLLSSAGHSEVNGYTISSPSAINILTWRSGNSLYAIAATGLDFETLEKL